MARISVEPERRKALVEAAIAEIGEAGSLGVTVGRIARRAGVSPALAHHYFGSKDEIFLAAMRRILRDFGRVARRELGSAEGPQARLDAIIRACFAPDSFSPEAVAAWLQFYVRAQTSPAAARLLGIYQRRLHSNLVHALRPLTPAPAALAETLGALIDGLYIRAALGGRGLDRAATETVRDVARRLLATQRGPLAMPPGAQAGAEPRTGADPQNGDRS